MGRDIYAQNRNVARTNFRIRPGDPKAIILRTCFKASEFLVSENIFVLANQKASSFKLCFALALITI